MSDSQPDQGSEPTLTEVQFRRRLTLLIAVISLTVPAAYLHGIALHRWGDHKDLRAHVGALADVPKQFGAWEYVGDGKPIAKHVQSQLELRGYLHRTYEHRGTAQRVTMLLLVGPSGPLVRHPPEICYQSRANRLLHASPLTMELGPETAHLRLLAYESASSVDGDFLVAYAFGSEGVWDNPASPRLAYAGRPVLYKLHALTDATSETSVENPKGLKDFLSQLLPTLRHPSAADPPTTAAN